MMLSADRVSGIFFFVVGTLFYLYVIPNYIESADSGSIHPDTFPKALSILITVCGLSLLLKPTLHKLHSLSDFLIAGAYFAVILLSLFAMSYFSYLYVSPILALALMYMIGERRIVWLISGSVVMPALIWLVIEVLLGRSLP